MKYFQLKCNYILVDKDLEGKTIICIKNKQLTLEIEQ